MTMPGRPRRPATAPPWVLTGLVIAIVAGLVWMHALSAGHHFGAAPAAGHATSIAADHCLDGHGDTDCPIHPPEHPGPICQSGAVPSASAAMPVAGIPVAHGRVDVMVAVPLSALTAAPDSGGGSGCGPPSLTMLSISRT